MNIVALATVKNEADIIEAFVRHTLAHVGRLVVMDNGSSDGTLEILRRLRGEGLALDIVEDRSPGFYQSRRMTTLMHDYAVGRYGADWVMPLDADEFLMVPPGAGSSLIPPAADEGRPLFLPWRVYAPHVTDDETQLNPVLRIRHRCVENSMMSKVLIPAALAAAPGAILPQGSHDIQIDGVNVPAARHPSALLAHFPIRSPGQFLAKVVLSALQYRTMGGHPDNDKGLNRGAYLQIKEDPPRFLATFWDQAGRYQTHPPEDRTQDLVADPFQYRGGPLRYTVRVDDAYRGWVNVVRYAEELALRYGALAPAAPDPASAEAERVEQRVDAVTAMRSQLDDLLLQLEAKELCIQQQHQEILRLQKKRAKPGLVKSVGRVLARLKRSTRKVAP